MFRRFGRKRTAVSLGAVAAVALAVAAYAYFTSTGSGSGTASVGTSSNIAITGSTTGETLYPGTSETVTFSVNNPSPGNQKLGVITLSGVRACPSGSSWDPTLNSNAGGCSGNQTEVTGCESSSGGATNDTTKNFYMQPVTENQDLASGTTDSAHLISGTGSLVMNDLNSSQDSCKSANLYLQFSAAAPAS